MAKDKSNGKKADLDKVISAWEEKLSLAVINKNKQEAESIRRMIDYYQKKKARE